LGLSFVTLQPAQTNAQDAESKQADTLPTSAAAAVKTDPAVIDDRFILCRVRTDLQRSLLGDVAESAADASLCVFINYAAFADEPLNSQSPSFSTLSDQLKRLAEADNRYALMRIMVADDSIGSEFEQVKERAQALAKLCEDLGRAAGFKRAKWTTSYGGEAWKTFIERAGPTLTVSESKDESSIGDEQVQVFPVRTFLSRLLANADCVVNFNPVVRHKEGTRFPDDFVPAMTKFIPQLEFDRKQKLLIRVRYAESAKDRLNEWVNDRFGREALANQFGFEKCNLQQSFTNEPEKADDAGAATFRHPFGELRLVSGAQPNVIAGRCLDENGRPLSGLKVVLLDLRSRADLPAVKGETTTDASGNYRFENVVDVSTEFPNGRIPVIPRADEHFYQVLIRSAGRVTTIQLASTFELARNGISWEHIISPAVTLRGRVTDPGGKPVSGAFVSLGPTMYGRPEGAQSARTDEEGRYEINDVAPFDPEKFRAEQEAQRQRDQNSRQANGPPRFSVRVAKGPPLLSVEHPNFALSKAPCEQIPGTKDVQLEKPAIIEGRVVYGDSGRPAANVPVQAQTRLSDRVPPSRDLLSRALTVYTRTDTDGTFRFATLPAGTYDFWPLADGWLHPGAVAETHANQDTTIPEIRLTRGGIVRIRLISATDGQPVAIGPDDEATFSVQQIVAGRFLQAPTQTVKPQPDGTFETRALPGSNVLTLNAVVSVNQARWVASRQRPPIFDVPAADNASVSVDLPVEPAPPSRNSAESSANNTQAAPEPVEIPIIVARHVLLHDGKIIEWADLEKMIAALPNPRRAHPVFKFTSGGAAEKQEEIRAKIWEFRRRVTLHGHTWASVPPDESARYDAMQPAGFQPRKGPTFRALVLESETNEPVAGIQLFKSQQPGQPRIEGVSDENGLLLIENMTPGESEFDVSAVDEEQTELAGQYARWWSPDAVEEHQRKIEYDNSSFQRNFDGLTFNILGNTVPVKIYVEKAVSIRGRVIDPDGSPVSGATVAPAKTGTGNSITGDTRYSVRTSADGTFHIRLPASKNSEYNLVAHDGGYREWRRWANGVGEVLTTRPGQELADVVLQLTRPGVVRGKVLDGDGKPLAKHRVRTQAADYLENRYYDPETHTNESGEFELKFVRPGDHFVQADPFWLVDNEAESDSSRRITVNPGKTADGIELIHRPAESRPPIDHILPDVAIPLRVQD
jgi:protocatechuate 3,4-dioxygenase beta subunit